MTKTWTTPADVRAQVQRLWDRGQLLAARLDGTSLFPWSVRSTRPEARELSDRFAEAREWIRDLDVNSKRAVGAGYDIVWAEVEHRQLGLNRVPQALVVPSEDDALALIGKRRQAQLFDSLVLLTRAGCPELLTWVARRPLALLEHAADWERILAVVAWFRDHPRPGLYTRQIDLPAVHTKFLESRKRLLAELLDLALPAAAIDAEALGAQHFEQRYGLLAKPTLLRFRILDERLRLHGLDDVTTPVAQFARLDLPVRRVFITENEINGLAFPAVPASLVIFGLGYGLERLARIPWLADKAIFYWGDLDTHGFAMLDAVRALFPGAQSLLMDRETLLAHRPLWVEEPDRCEKDLPRLTAAEREVYQELRSDRHGRQVRLEQERIAFGHLRRTLAQLVPHQSEE